MSHMRACALVACGLIALLGAACTGGAGGAAPQGPPTTAPRPPAPPPAEPEPPPPEALMAADCSDGPALTNRQLGSVIAASATRDTALRAARRRVQAAEEVVRTSEARLAGSESSLRSAEGRLAAARTDLEDFEADHPERTLPPALYEEWQDLVAAFERARRRYDRTYDDYTRVVSEHNEVVAAHNGEIAASNRLVRALNRLGKRRAKLSRRYQRDVARCLAKNDAGIAAQQANVQALEERLGALGSELGGREASAACSLTSWSKGANVLGYVRAGSAVMNLSPGVCHALFELVVLGEKPRLACLARSREAKAPLCSARPEQLALAVKTVAHEAQHIAGVRNEARAECFGLQRTAKAAAALRLESEGRDLAWYAWRFSRAPESYRSKACKPGGRLDRSPGTPSWP